MVLLFESISIWNLEIFINLFTFFFSLYSVVPGWICICTKSRRKIFVHFRNCLHLFRPVTSKYMLSILEHNCIWCILLFISLKEIIIRFLYFVWIIELAIWSCIWLILRSDWRTYLSVLDIEIRQTCASKLLPWRIIINLLRTNEVSFLSCFEL